MRIRLNNIGIIKDSILNINGLTVITGKNNSGKTTVGKALYSIVDAVCNLQQKAKADRDTYIYKQLEKVVDTMNVLRSIALSAYDDDNFLSKYSAIKSIFGKRYVGRAFRVPEAETFAHNLYNELEEIDIDALITEHEETLSHRIGGVSFRVSDNVSLKDIFGQQRIAALSILNQLFADLEKDPELVAYARENINRTLKVEFDGQIQPVRLPLVKSGIELSDMGKCGLKLEIAGNSVLSTGTRLFCNSLFDNAFFIDDPFVLDDMQNLRDFYAGNAEEQEIVTILNPGRIRRHNYRLKVALKYASSFVNTFEQNLLDEKLKPIQKKIDGILPGSFEFSSDGDYYVRNGAKLKLYNLATGSKLFSIIKILLNSGQLTKDTMLILDEPEAHLHPQWQNDFAEVIVLLVKELGVHVLLTTHSPNFVLALDANMREYDIADKTSFYQTQIDDNGMVDYRCVDNNIEFIYDDFVEYLFAAKLLRDKYLYGEEE